MNPGRLTHGRRKEIASLRQKKFRDQSGTCVVEGRRSVEAAIVAGARVVEIVATERMLDDPDTRKWLSTPASISIASPKEFEGMSDVVTSQGVLAVVETAWVSVETLKGASRILVLDGVQDPGNVGTIIRSAAWFGVEAVVIGPGVADCYGPKVLRSSMGGVWDVRTARTDSIAADIKTLISIGVDVHAADLEGLPLSEWSPSDPSCLVVGSEARGLSEDVGAVAKSRVRIPGGRTSGATESLNAGVAAGILMFHWTQRG